MMYLHVVLQFLKSGEPLVGYEQKVLNKLQDIIDKTPTTYGAITKLLCLNCWGKKYKRIVNEMVYSMYFVPFEDLPMYLDEGVEKKYQRSIIAKWRLKIGK